MDSRGTLNAQRSNAILLQCGMSASSHAASHSMNKSKGWWEDRPHAVGVACNSQSDVWTC
eukprot:3571115-Amphidinium_carterae.1